jgi:hypothetical protein
MVQDEVTFYGHPNIQSLHAKTIEITKDEHLTLRGDCIIGAVVRIEIMVGDKSLLIIGRGDERLSMLNAHEIVIRRTNFVCPRTMSVLCNKASSDVPRILVKMLQDQETKGIFRITLE